MPSNANYFLTPDPEEWAFLKRKTNKKCIVEACYCVQPKDYIHLC